MNLVQPGSFLTLHYRLSGPDGADVINTFGAKPATLSLGAGQLAPAIEQRLIGLAEGAHRRFDLAPGEPDGQGQYAGVVCEVGDEWVLFDFNHPLAGRPVSFEVQLIGVL